MSDDEETTLNVKGLDQLIRLLGVQPPTVRVGVLGDKAARNGSGPNSGNTNAEIGAFHEYGTTKLPQRSFLRVPIAEHLEHKMESAGAFDEGTLKETMASGTLLPYMKKVAILCESIVLGAFDSAGYGKWKASDMSRKKNAQTLVETQQLRNSITSEVKEGSG